MTTEIMDLSFKISQQHRPFELIAPSFELMSERHPEARGLHRTDAVPAAPFVAVEVDVDEAPGSAVAAGLSTTAGDHVLVSYDGHHHVVAIEVCRYGTPQVVRSAAATLTAPFRLAFVLCENQVTAVADTGDGWQPLLTERQEIARLVDLRDPLVLSQHAVSYGTTNREGQVRLAAVRGGAFGYTGLRDPHLVQRPDGSALIRDGKAYLTFTCAGMGFFQQAHWGVFTLDLADPRRLEQVAQLYSRRDGLVLGDHAGQLVVDEEQQRTIVVVSSWGDFAFDGGVHVRHCTTDADLLRGVHLLETEPLALPTAVSSWDPSLTRIDDRWYLAFVQSPSQTPFDFHPALAVSEVGGRYDQLVLAGADDTHRECEGPIIHRVGESWYVLASSKDTRKYPVYDLSMRRLGSLHAPYGTNIPHPQVVDLPDGGWLLVTFDGTQYAEDVLGYGGHGDLVVMSGRHSRWARFRRWFHR